METFLFASKSHWQDFPVKCWQFPVSHNISWIVLQRFPAKSWSVSILWKCLQNTLHCSHWNLNFDVANSMFEFPHAIHVTLNDYCCSPPSLLECSVHLVTSFVWKFQIPSQLDLSYEESFSAKFPRDNVTPVRPSCFFSAKTSPKNWWILFRTWSKKSK